MAWYNFGRKKNTSAIGFADQDNSGEWFQYFNQYMSKLGNDKLPFFKEEDAYFLASTIAEIFIPIDAIADRAASVNYDLVYEDSGEFYNPSANLKRLIDQPNPLDRFSDIVYKSVFSELSDGSSYIYTKTPESIKNPTIDNISNIWVLNPGTTKAVIKKVVTNPFLMKSKSDFIEYYKTFFLYQHDIEPRYVVHRSALGIDEKGYSKSPLTRVERNINNILAVYHARYNVYAKNGNAGILSADKSASNGLSIEQAVGDPVTRDAIVKDMQNRNGLTGNKNFIGISSIPLKYIKTLGTIQELQPFEETEENAIKIAGIFGVNKELIPRKGSSTFTNQKDAEKGLWQNVVKSICEDKAKDLTKAYYLPDGVVFKPNFSTVEVLQEDKKTGYEADRILIDNLDKMTQSGQDMSNAYNNLNEKYNG